MIQTNKKLGITLKQIQLYRLQIFAKNMSFKSLTLVTAFVKYFIVSLAKKKDNSKESSFISFDGLNFLPFPALFAPLLCLLICF